MVLASVPALATSAAAFTDPSAPFNECPAAGVSHSCGVLLVFEPDGTVHILTDPASGNPYESADDTTIGVLNQTGGPIPNVTLQGTPPAPGAPIFGFDGDGICSGVSSTLPNPADCSQYGVSPSATGATYAGPGIVYSGISSDATSGVVEFHKSCTGNTAASCSNSAGLNSGQTAFFSLESNLVGAYITIPKAGPVISSTTPSPSGPIGTVISDSAVPANGRVPSGTLTF